MLRFLSIIISSILLSIGFSSSAQSLEEWNWSNKNVNFVSIDDMEVTTNEQAQFEAHNLHFSMYLKHTDWNSKQEELIHVLLDIANVVNIDNERRVRELNNDGLSGYYLFGEADNEKLMVFILGNEIADVVVYGVLKYDEGWEKTALEMAKSIVINE